MRWIAGTLFVATAAFACGDSEGTNGTGTSDGGSASTSTASNTSDGGNDAGGGVTGGGGSTLHDGEFRYGVNFGYSPGWNDQQLAAIARSAGANGARLSFPESHFAQWGYAIEVEDNTAYQELGVRLNVAFLSGPTAGHSTAPGGGDTTHYIPSNLYEPIFLSNGDVNPDNYWAAYVSETMTTYKDYVKVYSVWNEPDWVDDYQLTLDWDTTAPEPSDLPRFNGSIYEYVRMLRVTKEVAAKVDPSIQVAVGGLGYPSFLAAILRYSDNPADGTTSSDYPATGGAYFDVVDMHYYPIFGPGSSDAGVDGLIALRDDFQSRLVEAGAGDKAFLVTETGAPRISVGGAPGGDAYARNYLLKSMVVAQAEGIDGIDWFALTDGQNPRANSFESMGLYENLTGVAPGAAVRTSTGEAYRTLGTLLEGAQFDASGMRDIPAEPTRGAAFVTKSQKRALVVWQRAEGATETATGSLTLSADAPWGLYEWDAAANDMAKTELEPEARTITVSLSATPVFLIEE